MKQTGDLPRTTEQLREHYEVEKRLANKLREANAERRKALYPEVYVELLQSVAHHPQLTRPRDDSAREQMLDLKMALLRRFLRADLHFLEIGAGDALLSQRVAPSVAQVYALDVSKESFAVAEPPANFTYVLSDGVSIPVPPESIDLAYSYMVMEHVHPEDAQEQLRNTIKALKPGGKFICLTPNRLDGPHDVSMFFDEVATGMHLKEYTFRELRKTFQDAGFGRVESYPAFRRNYFRAPFWTVGALEAVLEAMPFQMRRKVAGLPGIRGYLASAIVATK